jgi:hypothetical protein
MQLIMTRWSCQVEAENRNLAAQFVSVLPDINQVKRARGLAAELARVCKSQRVLIGKLERFRIVRRIQKGRTAASQLQHQLHDSGQ